MCPKGFEPAIPESERPQTHAVDRAVTGISAEKCTAYKLVVSMKRGTLTGEVPGVLHLVTGKNEAPQIWREAILKKRCRNALEGATSLKGINTISTR